MNKIDYIGIGCILLIMGVCIFVSLLSYDVGLHNGRYSMCQDMGKYYTKIGECLPCQEVGGFWIDEECIFEKQKDMELDMTWLNTTI